MEFALRTMMIVIILIIVLVMIIALLTGWGSQSGSLLDGVFRWFQDVLMPK